MNGLITFESSHFQTYRMPSIIVMLIYSHSSSSSISQEERNIDFISYIIRV